MGYHRRGIIELIRNREVRRDGRRPIIHYHHTDRFKIQSAGVGIRNNPFHLCIKQGYAVIGYPCRIIEGIGIPRKGRPGSNVYISCRRDKRCKNNVCCLELNQLAGVCGHHRGAVINHVVDIYRSNGICTMVFNGNGNRHSGGLPYYRLGSGRYKSRNTGILWYEGHLISPNGWSLWPGFAKKVISNSSHVSTFTR